MKCTACKNEIPDGSIFCMYCGKMLVKDRKREISVPKAKQLPSGNWFIYLRIGGQAVPITETTEAKATAKARALKAGYLKAKNVSDLTFSGAIDRYIRENSNTLSPATIRGYRSIQKNRFKSVMGRSLRAPVHWQSIINAEAGQVSPKSVKNAWALLTRVMKLNGCEIPDVNLPQVPKAEQPFLDPDQIRLFLAAMKGHPDEYAALLALHSLRRSELAAADVSKDLIRVRGAVVLDEHNNLVAKAVNKNETSTRTIPVMIPRLKELPPIVQPDLNHLNERINRVCKAAGLPAVGVHGLRRSFASLAYFLHWPTLKTMQTGGWKDLNTVMKIYTYLSAEAGKTADKSMADFYQNANENVNALK